MRRGFASSLDLAQRDWNIGEESLKALLCMFHMPFILIFKSNIFFSFYQRGPIAAGVLLIRVVVCKKVRKRLQVFCINFNVARDTLISISNYDWLRPLCKKDQWTHRFEARNGDMIDH